MTPTDIIEEKFESPLSQYIRLFCSQCPKWSKTCSLSSIGFAQMQFCLWCALLFGYEEISGE